MKQNYAQSGDLESETIKREDVVSLIVVNLLNVIMLEERAAFCKSAHDSGNGFRHRQFKMRSGARAQLAVPRLRHAAFQPEILRMVKRHAEELEKVAMGILALRCDALQVNNLLRKLLPGTLDAERVETIARGVHIHANSHRGRMLPTTMHSLAITRLDYDFSPLGGKPDTEVWVALGQNAPNQQARILGLYNRQACESGTFLTGLVQDLQDRGLAQVLRLICDNHSILVGAAQRAWHQKPELW